MLPTCYLVLDSDPKAQANIFCSLKGKLESCDTWNNVKRLHVASAGRETHVAFCESITAEFDLDGEIRKSFPERAMLDVSTKEWEQRKGPEEGQDMCSRGLEEGQCAWRGTASLRCR